jgi:hypothetical protein
MKRFEDATAIYVRIPKTASCSIVKALRGHKQILCNDINNFLEINMTSYLSRKNKEALGAELWKKCFKFSFVRNPFDRCVSSWKMTNRRMPFKVFVKNLIGVNLKNPKKFSFNAWHCCLQTSHVTNWRGKCMLDFIGKFERLQDDFDEVCDRVGIDKMKLPHLNKTKHDHYTSYYDGETKALVGKIYKKDIKFFGYEFE